MGITQESFDPKSVARSRTAFGPMMIRTPIPFIDGIVASTVMGTINVPLTLTLRPSGTASTYMTGDLGQMLFPIVPICECADQTSIYRLDIQGWDQFGDGPNGPGGAPFVETGTKFSAVEVITRFDFRAYSRIKSIVVTPLNAAAAADTIVVGWQWDVAGTPITRIPLPFKSRRQIVTSATTAVGDWSPHVAPVGLGGGTFASLAAYAMAQVNTQNGNFVGTGAVSVGWNSSSDKSVIALNANWNGVFDQTAGIDFLIGFRNHADLTV